MKTAVVLVAGAFAFLVGSSTGAWADVVEPKEPVQPIASNLLDGTEGQASEQPSQDGAAPAEDGEAPAAQEPAPATAEANDATAEAVAPVAPEPVRTPATEVVVRAAPARDRAGAASGGWTVIPKQVRQAANGLVGGAHAILGHLAEACSVGVAKGSGGPVLAFAVLSVALALERRWTLWARPWTDEDRPSYLSALEVIDPG